METAGGGEGGGGGGGGGGDESRQHKPSGSDFAHLFVFANEKAGMKKVDKEHVNQVIYDMSKNSAYFRNAQRQDASTQERVKSMRRKLALVRPCDLDPVRLRVEKRVAELEREREQRDPRIFCVVDMDMFFAAVHMRDDPSLIGQCIAVGGNAMISTANYEARQYGVRSAMPGFVAKKLCPQLKFVGGPGSGAKYKEASEQVREVLREYDPHLSGSIDEAYMDITRYVDEHFGADKPMEERMGFAFRAVEEMRTRVSQRTRLTCSAGIATSRMVAKIASDFNKPNGQHLVPADAESTRAFVRALPVRKIPGIGKVTEKVLSDALGVQTVEDLWRKRVLAAYLFSNKSSDWFLRVALCCTDSRGGVAFETRPSSRKSISTERTFRERSEPKELLDTCRALCEQLAKDCAKAGVVGRCVTVKLKSTSFEIKSRQTQVSNALPKDASGDDLFQVAKELLVREFPCRLRLMGVRLSHLDAPPATGAAERARQEPLKAFFGNAKAAQPSAPPEAAPPEAAPPDAAPPEDAPPEDAKENAKELGCPVCGARVSAADDESLNVALNQHIDLCLNAGLVEQPCRPAARPATIDRFFSSRDEAPVRKRARPA